MKFLRALIANSVFSLNVLLVFLVIFRNGLDVPTWLQPLGRMHPLLLHLPIGLLLLAALLVVFRSSFKKKPFHNFLNFVLYFSALTAALTAIMGLLLSREGGYDENQLNLHLATGVCVSLLSAWLLGLSLYALKRKIVFHISLVIGIVVLLTAGHLGSVLTHGENFILQPLSQDTNDAVTDSTSLYAAVIHPILKSKCMSCHNERKVKGNLNMASLEKILKGGKHGPIWVAGNPDSSTIIRRIHLPEENDDHMPPTGKTPLSKTEMKLLYEWILAGADVITPWTKFKATDSLRVLATEFINQKLNETVIRYAFPFASKEAIQKLNTPFCTVAQLASDEPALKADFFLSQAFNIKNLEGLLDVKEQLVILNLAKMPVTDAEGKIISQFKNLEKINLNQTNITGNILSSLKGLSHLKSISLAGTAIDKKSLNQFAGLPSLKEVFLWNTNILSKDNIALQKQFPGIVWDQGYQSDEILSLTPPILVNESFLLSENERIHLKHNLPGTQIRYTLDGSNPDSINGTLYSVPIAISKYSILTTRAFKDGWFGSLLTQFYFFKKGLKPTTAALLNPPNKDYKGEGIATLTDNKKGAADNFKDIAWLGYREKPFVALFSLEQPNTVSSLTLSYCENFGSFLLPPAFVELWVGNEPGNLKLLQKIVPVQPTENGPRVVKGIVFQFAASTYPYFKLIAQPVVKVPVWVSKKPEKGWVFVDEVIFN